MKPLVFLLLTGLLTQAATTIDPSNRCGYGANVGWLDWRGDSVHGAVIGEYVCSGYVYCANVGWINLGSGAPANGIQYQNTTVSDFGINHDGMGNLRGKAYGANVGWISFENYGSPKVDLATGRMSGSVYGANIGWISLSNAFAVVQTTSITPGADADGDGICDAWELLKGGNLGALSHGGDADGDGVSDWHEYLADTDPFDPNSKLSITATSFNVSGGIEDDLVTWTARPTRFYELQYSVDLGNTNWVSCAGPLSSAGVSLTSQFQSPSPAVHRYFRVRATKPLSP